MRKARILGATLLCREKHAELDHRAIKILLLVSIRVKLMAMKLVHGIIVVRLIIRAVIHKDSIIHGTIAVLISKNLKFICETSNKL